MMGSPNDELPRWICLRQVIMGIGTTRLAKFMNRKVPDISKWRRGVTKPLAKDIPKLAIALGVSEATLRKKIGE